MDRNIKKKNLKTILVNQSLYPVIGESLIKERVSKEYFIPNSKDKCL